MDLEGLIRRVPSEPLAVQLYAASPLAIGIETDAERQYLRRLAPTGCGWRRAWYCACISA